MKSSTRDRPTGRLKRRRVIERPRLFALLDESPNRIRTLVAPAGYGKTTLAEQWVARQGRRGACACRQFPIEESLPMHRGIKTW